jgi:nucleoid DNA-binding protein
MPYDELLARISEATGVDPAKVRQVLDVFPDIVMMCQEGEKVWTPLGTFKIIRRPAKRVRLPNGEWTVAVERVQAKLHISRRLKAESGASELGPSGLADKDPTD